MKALISCQDALDLFVSLPVEPHRVTLPLLLFINLATLIDFLRKGG